MDAGTEKKYNGSMHFQIKRMLLHFFIGTILLSTNIFAGSTDINFEKLDMRAIKSPASLKSSPKKLVKYLIQDAKTDLEKTRVRYRWIAEKITGYSKGYGFSAGSETGGNTCHAWKAVKIEGKWVHLGQKNDSGIFEGNVVIEAGKVGIFARRNRENIFKGLFEGTSKNSVFTAP